MSEQLAQVASQIETLTTEIRGLRSDVAAMQRESDELRREFRAELKAVRGDLALITSRQNSAIAENKKKSPDWSGFLLGSTGD